MASRASTRAVRPLCAALLAVGLAACSQNEAPDDAPAPAPPVERVATAAEALANANIPTLDPATMAGAEIRKVVGERPHCTFRYTSSGKPVLVAGLGAGGAPEIGVAKLNGKLVPLEPDRTVSGLKAGGFALMADRVRLRVQPDRAATASAEPGDRVEAEMLFEVGQELKVGYAGYLTCRPGAAAPAAAQ